MTKKFLILLFALIFFAGCKSDSYLYLPRSVKKSIRLARKDKEYKEYKIVEKKFIKSKGYYPNQGEADSIRAHILFKVGYKKTDYSKFDGEIITKDSVYQIEREDSIYDIVHPKIQFGETQNILLFDVDIGTDYQLIFEKGIFYPAIFGLEIMHICCIKELPHLSDNPQIKRFCFYLWDSDLNLLNSYRNCYFELINENAKEETDWNSFIENAKLTFVKDTWGAF